jgi:hypothetical protein
MKSKEETKGDIKMIDNAQNALVPHTHANKLKDRIKELRRVPANTLKEHPQNWRVHPQIQQTALEGVLAQIGIADAVLAFETENGALTLIDGHLRKDILGDTIIPVLVTDLTEDEARLMLATHDPLTAMATQNDELILSLLSQVTTDNEDVRQLLESLREDAYIWNPDISEVENTEPINIGLIGTITVKAPQNIIPDLREAIEKAVSGYDEVIIV